ncbi:aerobic respiration control protein ArcA [Escherichia coli]|uniref:Aerobic respiration control protein ArcA n=1 Tax=Escherichia coli TaxID=562 RepID=A0A376U2U7_ECOLX|nr:aerobic respiration control protein ArcA [Escherichia coli]
MHQILSEYDINLVIMDINLPGKNGLLLARELREQANVALMFLTGRDNEVDKILASKSVQMTTSPNRSTRVN